jgi:hypothetical protein
MKRNWGGEKERRKNERKGEKSKRCLNKYIAINWKGRKKKNKKRTKKKKGKETRKEEREMG